MEDRRRAFNFAVRALTGRDHSEAEIRRKMEQKGISAEAADDAVDRLKRCGYLDDGRFARRIAESAVSGGRWYGCRLRFELSRRGIAEDTVAEVVERMRSEYDETEAVRAVLSRKFADFAPRGSDERRKRRVIGFLQRRGFSLTAILQVFREMGGE